MPLVKPVIGQDPWGDVLNAALDYLDQSRSAGLSVADFGADATGSADSGAAINAAIAASTEGQVIVFPGGTYTIETPVLLKANRSYYGPGAILKQKASTELDAMVMVDPGEGFPRRNILWFGIHLDGNAVDPATGLSTNNTIYTAGSQYTKNKGLVLSAVQFCNFFDLAIRACGNDGLTVTGSDQWAFEQQSSTNHFISPYIYGNGGRGVVFGPVADDNHVLGGDIGDQNFACVHFYGGSSSLRDSTIWGSRNDSGVIVGAPSNQIINCQVEGHAQHGIAVLTRFASWTYIAGCKIYDNSNSGTGQYDGIYVNGDPGYTNIVGANATTTEPAIRASVNWYPRQDYDYSGGNAITFTVNDGSGANTVTLNANYAHQAALVSAIAAQLGTYQVSASGGYVVIAAAAAGLKTITVGGTNAAAVTAAAGYPVSYVTIVDNFLYGGIGDFYLNESHEVDPAAGGGYFNASGVWVPGHGWVGQRHSITLDTLHQYCTVNNNNAQFSQRGAGAVDAGFPQPPIEVQHGGPDPTQLGVYGLKAGDTYNGMYWSTSAEEDARLAASPRAFEAGQPWFRPDTGQLKLYTGPSRDRIERVLTSKYDVEGGQFTGNGASTQDVSIPNVRFDVAYTVLLSPSWGTTWWITGKTGTQFTVNYGTPGTGAVDYTIVRHSG